MHWKDVSIPMHAGMTVWPGDVEFAFEASSRIIEGAECNVSHVTMSTHTGTHVDAPWHFEDNGKRLDEVDFQVFFGEALLIDVGDVNIVRAADLGPDPLPPRVLLKSKNSAYPAEKPFLTDFVAVDIDAAERMVAEGVKLVGVDYLSVAPHKQPGQPTHHILLENDVFIVEGLRLQELDSGTYSFTVLPLPLQGADGAPCRAFIQVEN
jgi:arylformamidase